MVCIGARFDDRITGKLDAFSPDSKKIHIDIDPSSINKNIRVDVPVIGDCGEVLQALIHELKSRGNLVAGLPCSVATRNGGGTLMHGVLQDRSRSSNRAT
jgi:thiamine pyrophosphate-dependent acetolactate synthase large subunit-like protein